MIQNQSVQFLILKPVLLNDKACKIKALFKGGVVTSSFLSPAAPFPREAWASII